MLSDSSFVVLVVDDDRPTFELLERLGREQFPQANFVWTTSFEETIQYLDTEPAKLPQLVLLDINLHQPINGLAILPQLRTRFKGQVPVVMLTVSDAQPEVKQAYETGAIAFTRKPDNLQSWKEYVTLLRNYWYETTLLPPTDPPPVNFLRQF